MHCNYSFVRPSRLEGSEKRADWHVWHAEYVQKYARGGAAAKCSAPDPQRKKHVVKHQRPIPPSTASVHAGSPAPDSLMQSTGPLDAEPSPSKPPQSDDEEEDELLGLLSDSEDDA